MAPTEAAAAAPLVASADTLRDCLALSAEARWNQCIADWELFFSLGAVFGCADASGKLCATGAILPYANDFGWIGMVLVTQASRRQGLGTLVLRRCIAALQEQGRIPALDATPAGALVYRPLGFTDHFGLTRWRRPAGDTATPPPGLRRATAEDLPGIVALDAAAFGAARPALMADLLRRAPHQAFVTDTGFVLARDGRQALQIGPVVASDEAEAAALLEAAIAATPGDVLLDTPPRWTRLAALVQARGFAAERGFTRMALGRAAPFGAPEKLFVVAGPEIG
jgi:GNAT superfamily N-acetyltransferase